MSSLDKLVRVVLLMVCRLWPSKQGYGSRPLRLREEFRLHHEDGVIDRGMNDDYYTSWMLNQKEGFNTNGTYSDWWQPFSGAFRLVEPTSLSLAVWEAQIPWK